ncbi:MAG TPA: alpha/beta hydrolase [Steroidobacteraceae bacterium]|nr:alpha/beta hydrolase [Steroidobacteraceae bacterium]
MLLLGYAALRLSPWPAALAIRLVFEAGGRQMNAALERFVPVSQVTGVLDEHYAPADPDARLDVFYPRQLSTEAALLTVVWIHGGAFVAGSKEEVRNYVRILAAHGVTGVAVDYSLAPGRTYPTPVRQVNAALAYLAKNAARLHVDPRRFVLAGDSAGAQLAAQLANLTSSADYAREVGVTPALGREQLAGVLLYCGPYGSPGRGGQDRESFFVRSVLWSYSGRRDFRREPGFQFMFVAEHLSAAFPPTFISVGNADPLAPDSYALATTLKNLGVPLESLFFPADHEPPLPHEYQFNLAAEAGQEALTRSLAFLDRLRSSPAGAAER